MITLAIDTSTSHGSVALHARNSLAYSHSFKADRSHSQALFESLEKAVECSDKIDQIAIGLGPGSYAGVRIAIAAALGLSMTFGAKLVGLSSLSALDVSDSDYMVIGDARREAFFFARLAQRQFMDGPELVAEGRLRELIGQFPHLKVFASATVSAMPTVQVVRPSAAILAQMAAEGRGILSRGNLEPLYLREPSITQPKARAF